MLLCYDTGPTPQSLCASVPHANNGSDDTQYNIMDFNSLLGEFIT